MYSTFQVTDYFLNFVEMETKAAKSAGAYDVGITTISGRTVEFVGQPRSFCFGGAASQQTIQIYQVQVDQGLSFETALEIYRKEQGANDGKVKTGFYLQEKRGRERIYLIINAGDKCIAVRPNVGRRVITKGHIMSKIRYGEYTKASEIEAKDMWNQEFDLADIPSTEGTMQSVAVFI